MRNDIRSKIQDIADGGHRISEHETRVLGVLVRKRLETLTPRQRERFLTLNLFCNWMLHTSITTSMTGLRTLARVNDTLVKVKGAPTADVIRELSTAIGFKTFRSELTTLLDEEAIRHDFSVDDVWKVLRGHVIEIIRDVPLEFPPLGRLDKRQRRIYDQITKNPIKPGAGVVSMAISEVDYAALGATGYGTLVCLVIGTEDTTRVVVPLSGVLE